MMTTRTLERTKPVTRQQQLPPGVWAEFEPEVEKETEQRQHVKKSVHMLGRIIGLFMGSKFTTPALELYQKEPITTTVIPVM
jgi:hypothetical protein